MTTREAIRQAQRNGQIITKNRKGESMATDELISVEKKGSAHVLESAEIAYPVTQNGIALLVEKYSFLSVGGLNDRAGLKAVREARLECKAVRVAVENARKEHKKGVLELGRKIDQKAKDLIGPLLPVEEHLQAEEQKIADEKERIAREAEEARQAKLNERLEQLAAAECMLNPATVEAMDDTKFEATLSEAVAAKAKRDADRAAEEQRLAAEREALERQRIEAEKIESEARAKAEAERQRIEAEQAEERRKLAAEREKIEADRRAIELEKAKAEAAEKARREESERIKREAEEAERRAKAEQAERERLEALRPEVAKIRAYANDLCLVGIPEGISEASTRALRIIVNRAANEVREVADSL